MNYIERFNNSYSTYENEAGLFFAIVGHLDDDPGARRKAIDYIDNLRGAKPDPAIDESIARLLAEHRRKRDEIKEKAS